MKIPAEQAHKELLLPGLAIYASPENLERYVDIVISEDSIRYSSERTQKNLPRLSKIVIPIVMSGDLRSGVWTVEPWHIRVSLRRFAEIHLDDDSCISMPDENTVRGPDSRFVVKNVHTK